jgi:hypothetical protein
MRKYFQNAADGFNWYQYCRLFTRKFQAFISYLKYDN